MIGKMCKLNSLDCVITGYAETDKKYFLVWVKLGEDEIALTGKQLKNFLESNKLR